MDKVLTKNFFLGLDTQQITKDREKKSNHSFFLLLFASKPFDEIQF